MAKKGNKNLNPADRERKKQRAHELKRNKKQRNTVRQAIVKGRNSDELLEQLRRLDDQEFDPKCELSKHVIIEKRTKTKGAFIQQLAMYRQENDENQVIRLEALLHEYDNDRLRKEEQYRALLCSDELTVGEIPLPGGYSLPNAAMTPFVMPSAPQPPHWPRNSILKSAKTESTIVHKHPPGPPCGLPPSFDDAVIPNRSRRVQFSKNYEQTYDDYDVDDEDFAPVAMPDSLLPPKSNFQPVRSLISAPPLPPNAVPPPPQIMPSYQRYLETQQQRPQIPVQNSTIDAPPHVSRPTSATHATISAEPQMRNFKKETTRFVPTALHVGRPDTNKPKPFIPSAVKTQPVMKTRAPTTAKKPGKSADDACDDFLREIQDLL